MEAARKKAESKKSAMDAVRKKEDEKKAIKANNDTKKIASKTKKNTKKKVKKLVVESITKNGEESTESSKNESTYKCPSCFKDFPRNGILHHINKSSYCNKKLGSDEKAKFKSEVQRNSNVIRNRKYREKKKGSNPEAFREQNRKAKEKHKRKMKESDPEAFKEANRKAQENHTKNMQQKDPEHFKEVNRSKMEKFRERKREVDPESLKQSQNRWQSKRRRRESSEDRLKAFQIATLYASDFICISCHQRHFVTNVQKFDKNLRNKIKDKIRFEDCIEDLEVYSNVEWSKNEKEVDSYSKDKKQGTRYICKTCVGYLIRGKLPPSSVKNGLTLRQTDKDIEDEGLTLTELEASLVAKRIIFQKIFLLPKSRWTGLKDRQVNIPITDDSINRTLQMLPRTPKMAGLIGVCLKRKAEFKSSHQKQLIDPKKIFLFLDKMKLSGNKYYKDIETFEAYHQRCLKSDEDGFQLVFEEKEDNKNEEINEESNEVNETFIRDEIEGAPDYEKKLLEDPEEEHTEIEKDVIKKFQMKYDESVVMVDKYPEITVAPGEGQTPLNVLFDKDWDVQAFPHLHNADGSNGKDQEREVKLTDQRYFIQRINNKELRFSRSPAYLYSAVGYLDKKQIQSNINLVGTRGEKVMGDNGQYSYKLHDEYRVFEGLPGSVKYWHRAKYEMLARLDNLGAFQLFFTLSCADLRWEPSFASILRDGGYTLHQEVIKIDGHWKQHITVKVKGEWKPLKNFIEEDLKESYHQMIRGNVSMATRYFNQRVKSFFSNIVMDKSNPMSVKYFSYRVEFQARGAGHIHGTLWLDLKKLEKLVLTDGRLKEENTNNSDKAAPFQDIDNAFRRLRNDQQLSKVQIKSLINFVDSFTTVTTDPGRVGADVAQIAKEVNRHNHTKSCRKYGAHCRFNYPKLPSPETLIARPLTESGKAREKKVKKYNSILNGVRVAMSDDEVIDDIMKKVPKDSENYEESRRKRIRLLLKKADTNMDEYLEALQYSSLGYSIVLQRDIDELCQNPFNVEWLRAWNGNMDIQVCLDFHAVITYITDYIEKPDTAMQELITEVLEKDGSNNIKDRMKAVANVFLTTRQMGEAEAVYRLNPSLLLKNSNILCQWVSLGERKDRSSRWMKANQEQIDAGLKLVNLENHEGKIFSTITLNSISMGIIQIIFTFTFTFQ